MTDQYRPAEPLIEIVSGREQSISRLLGGKDHPMRRAYYRAVQSGSVHARMADRIATWLRLHPADIWGDDYWNLPEPLPRSEYHAAYYQANRERIRAQQRSHRARVGASSG